MSARWWRSSCKEGRHLAETEKKGFFHKRIGELIAAVILGFLEVIALSLYYRDSLSFWMDSLTNGLLFFGIWILSAALLFLFFALLELLIRPERVMRPEPLKKVRFSDAHPFLFSALVLTVFYLPWLLVFYPGSAIYDMTYQMVQGVGFQPINAHHPIFATWVIGLCGRLSLALTGKLNLGIFIYVLLQSAICVLSFSSMFSFMAKRGIRRGYWISLLFVFAVVPLFGGAMQCGTKDTMFTGLFVWFLVLLAELLLGEGPSFRPVKWAAFGLLILLLCLYRNGILVIMVPSLVVFLIALRKEKRVRLFFTIAGALALICGFLFQTIAARAYHTGTETGEMLSIPFQQTARYVRDHETEVTDEEAKVIEETFVLDDFRELGTLYYPMSSDPVKARYHWYAADNEGSFLKSYFGAWAGMLKKHPLTYLEATAANTYGYYAITPVIKKQKGGAGTPVQFFPDQLAVQGVIDRSGGTLSEDLIPESPEALQGARDVLSGWYSFWQKAPVLGLFLKCVFYFYILLAFTLCYGRRKNKLSLLAVPLFLLVLMAIASPVNEHIRYIFPVIAVLPLLPAAAAKAENENKMGGYHERKSIGNSDGSE